MDMLSGRQNFGESSSASDVPCNSGNIVIPSEVMWSGVFQFRETSLCGLSGRVCRGIAEKSGAALESGKSIYFRGGEELVSGVEEAVFVGSHGEYSYSGRSG
jgi:hypothetical protein